MIKIQSLYKSYPDKKIFEDFNLEIKSRRTCIVGNSGIGKTTLLRLISRLESEDAGTIEAEKPRVSFIFQEDRLIPWKTVGENIAYVCPDKAEIERVLKDVNLLESINLYPNELSGGMKQRVSIARAFVKKADILLMDEPFQGLDPNTVDSIIRMIDRHISENDMSLLFASHDIKNSLKLADEVILFSENPIKVINKWEIDEDIRHNNYELIRQIEFSII